ncbi:WD-40 repeat protein [Nostoc carneum NIES-2107]|nr:WD-40 repeat protein [Nostoc carneum NIES-2107]
MRVLGYPTGSRCASTFLNPTYVHLIFNSHQLLSVDATIKLWQLDGTEITTLRGHTAAIRKIAISQDGTFLASGGDDNTLIIWNLPRILKTHPLAYGCNLVQDYLRTNTALQTGDRSLCDRKIN